MSNSHEPLGLYVHVPFCEQKCAYCDFFTVTDPDRAHPLFDSWLDLCLAELRLWRRDFPELAGRPVETIFFGGGTPSLLPPELFARFIDEVKTMAGEANADVAGKSAHATLEADADDQRRDGAATLKNAAAEFDGGSGQVTLEVSLETQPATLAEGDYARMMEAGITRFSIGVQTFNPRLLDPTARRHTVADSEETLQRAKATDAAVSLDMICALPGQTMTEWHDDLERAISFAPHHMSVYEMTYHAGTEYFRQWKRGRISQADDDLRVEMFRHTRSRMQQAGYRHYEISNYALPGCESRHNRIYWTLGDFVGLGAGAHSFINGHRYANPRSANDYARAIREGKLFARSHDSTDADITLVENLQMALRLTEGADMDWLSRKLGQDIRKTRMVQLDELASRGWITLANNRLRLTTEGQLYADSVSEHLL